MATAEMGNGTKQPVSIMNVPEGRSAVNDYETLLERNKSEWMEVTRVVDKYLFVFIVVVTLIVALIIGVMMRYRL